MSLLVKITKHLLSIDSNITYPNKFLYLGLLDTEVVK